MTATSTRLTDLRLRAYRARRVPERVRGVLVDLTLPEGQMWSAFTACADPNRGSWSGAVTVAELGGETIGWALRWKGFHADAWSVHVFVHPAWRRQRVGTMLADAARPGRATVLAQAWDEVSAAFWETQRGFTIHFTHERNHDDESDC